MCKVAGLTTFCLQHLFTYKKKKTIFLLNAELIEQLRKKRGLLFAFSLIFHNGDKNTNRNKLRDMNKIFVLNKILHEIVLIVLLIIPLKV